MRLIRPDGVACEFKRGVDPEFDALCCSYGLFGVVTEVTFQLVPHADVSLRHEQISLDEFEDRTRELLAGGYALFLYLFPYDEPPRIIAEVRCNAATDRRSGAFWLRMRNFFWVCALHYAVRLVRRLPQSFGKLLHFGLRMFLVRCLYVKGVSPVDQIVDFRHSSPKFTFSMWAFPKEPAQGKPRFAEILREYFEFCRRTKHNGGFHSLLPHVSYHIAGDKSSLLSYSYDGDVWTIDPIASGDEPGWKDFLDEFNKRCSAWGGKPLFNQTPRLNRNLVVRAFGTRLANFEAVRGAFDPDERMLNDYFASLLR